MSLALFTIVSGRIGKPLLHETGGFFTYPSDVMSLAVILVESGRSWKPLFHETGKKSNDTTSGFDT